MDGDSTGLELSPVVQPLRLQPAVRVCQRGQYRLVHARSFIGPVRSQPLQPMASPDVWNRVNCKQRAHFVGVPTRDDDDTGATIIDNLLQKRGDRWIGIGMLAIETEWSKSSVIIEQQRRNWRACDRFHEPFNFD